MGLANKIKVPGDCENASENLGRSRGIYVHVPFCSHACDFCAFYQIEPKRADIDRYLNVIESEFLLVDPAGGCTTAFWGGGTPGLLPARDLERLARAQLRRFGAPMLEWTVELAPGSVRADKLAVLKDAGVTRVSLGVQSLVPATLEALGRRHSLEQIRKAWALIQAAEFSSTNLDLMFAIPGQTIEQLRSDLVEAVQMAPDHLSTYCLSFEEDTAMFVRLSSGRVSIDPERERDFYEETWERLAAGGFEQYEVSNHARPGHRCVHNVNTWRMQEWCGFGPSAASQESGRRGSNPADLDLWANDVALGRRSTAEAMDLDASQLAEDALIFGLRMNEGVDLKELGSRFGAPAVALFRAPLQHLVEEDLARWTALDRIALTHEGRLVADAIGVELLGMARSTRA